MIAGYKKESGGQAPLFSKEHNNGDETLVSVTEDPDNPDGYVVVAADALADGSKGEQVIVGRENSKEMAMNAAEAWMRQNPKGVAPPQDSGGMFGEGGGIDLGGGFGGFGNDGGLF